MLFSILYKLNYNYVYNEPIFLACLITKLSLIKHLMCGNYSPLLCRCAILFVIFIQFLFHAILLFTDPYRSIKLLHSCQLWNVNFLIHSWLLNCHSSLNCKLPYIIPLLSREIEMLQVLVNTLNLCCLLYLCHLFSFINEVRWKII